MRSRYFLMLVTLQLIFHGQSTCLAGEAREQPTRIAVRQRLQKAAIRTAQLRQEARTLSREQLHQAGIAVSHRIAVFPTSSQLKQLIKARPWCRDYWAMQGLAEELRFQTRELSWPTVADRDELRQLTNAEDPDIRALAIEALATLHHPDDLDIIVRYLNNDAQVVPVLRASPRLRLALILPRPHAPVSTEPVVVEQSWQSSRVMDYAERALELMTGHVLDAENYWKWPGWKARGRAGLWYWQRRYERELYEKDPTIFHRHPEETIEQWVTRREQLHTERRAALRKELAAMPPEVEAKVRLLARPGTAGGADITEPDQHFFDGPAKLRLEADRLFELIDGQGLWNDVAWRDEQGELRGERYNLMVERLGLSAEHLYGRQDVPRLKAALERHRDNLWWSGQTALIRGISRLLPPAGAGQLDNVATREGWLRHSIRHEEDVFVRGYTARELVRIGLPESWPFLKTVFFKSRDKNASPDVRQSIVIALGKPPLTREKLTALIDLIEDPRSHPLLTRPNRAMGDDMYRLYAVQAINRHAGKQHISDQECRALVDAERSSEAWKTLLSRLRELGERK